MIVLQSSCDSTSCYFGDIPKGLINFDCFKNATFEGEFCKIFGHNPLNPRCPSCHTNWSKLLYGLSNAFNVNAHEKIDIRFASTRTLFQNGYKDFLNTFKYCPYTPNEIHASPHDVFGCDYCVRKSSSQLEMTVKTLLGQTWRPTLDFGLAACHIHRVFTYQLYECKMGCLPDPILMLWQEF